MRATNLQQHNIQKTKTILLQCKNPLFARQKPYFCIAKTMLLFCEYVTYTEWTRCKHSVNIHIHPRKHPTYTPQNINEHPKTPNLHTARRRGPIHRARIFPLPNPYFPIIKYVYSFHRKRISVRHFVDIYGYAGTINWSPTAANGLQITLLANWNNVANSPQNIHIQPRNACERFATT